MPSCDGSNCGACACNCDYKLKQEIQDLKREIAELKDLKTKIETEIAKSVSETKN